MNAAWGEDCKACGDPAEKMHNGKPYCLECWAELAHGVISTRPSRYYREGAAKQLRPREEDNGSR